MTVPTSEIRFSAIQTEFGGSNPISLSEYYRGATYAPAGQTVSAAQGGGLLSSAGTIRAMMFSGIVKLGTSAWVYRSGLSAVNSNTMQKMVWMGNKFVAIGQSSSSATSTDGVTWTNRTGLAGGWDCNALCWNGTKLVADQGGYCVTSTDGITWAGSDGVFGSVSYPTGLAWNGTVFVVVGRDTNSAAAAATSTDGVTWTDRSSFASAFNTSTGLGPRDVVWSGSKFVAVGGGNTPVPVCVTSTDGTTWSTQSGLPSAITFGFVDRIVSTGSQVVAFSSIGGAATSSDGVTWTLRSDFATAFGSEVVLSTLWTGSKILVAGGAGKVVSSTDGITWITEGGFRNTGWGSTGGVFALATSGSVIAAVGETGRCATA